MKTFELEFYRSHSRLSNVYVAMTAQARDLERVLPRVKKILEALKKLPNPHSHSEWSLIRIKELEKQ